MSLPINPSVASPAPLFDSHCHLNYDYAPKSLEDLLSEAKQAGVETLVTIGTDLPHFAEVQKISEQYENIYHTIGIHPHEAETLRGEDLPTLERLARHPKCRAIGEIGLDYYYKNVPKDVQIKQLKQQLDLALKLNLPVVIHGRDAEEDLLRELTDYCKSLPQGSLPGIIHCFTSTADFGLECIELGFYISFSGILTFKNAEDVRNAATLFPLDRLLVETDSPYLAPIPFRGKKCEPSMVKHTALKLAEIKGVSFEELARVTTANAKRVFGIK